MGQDKVRMTHRVVCGKSHWECALIGDKFYVTAGVDLGFQDRVFTVHNKRFVEDIYDGYTGYEVTKLKQFKGNV